MRVLFHIDQVFLGCVIYKSWTSLISQYVFWNWVRLIRLYHLDNIMKTLLYTAKSSVFCTFYIWMEWLYINKIKYKIHLYRNYNIEYINNFTKKKKKNTSIFIIFSLFLVFVDLFPYFSSLLDSYSQNLSLREKALQSLYNYSFYLFLVTNFFFC